jgi:hypothetical protein
MRPSAPNRSRKPATRTSSALCLIRPTLALVREKGKGRLRMAVVH